MNFNIKIKLSTIVIMICISLLLSCSDDFLDRQPLDQVVSSNFYKTEGDAMEALVSVYDALQYQSSPGVGWAPFITISDILSDDCFAGGADANDGQEENELNQFRIPTTSPIVQSIWLKNYVGIYRANLLLERIGEIDATESFKSRVIGECKFLRAYFYLELVRFFENIPLLVNTISGPSEYEQEQNAPAEVYQQIASDLLDALAVLPESIPQEENGRISKWAAQGLLGRAYLFYNGVYGADLNVDGNIIDRSSVLAHLEDIIQNSGHGLIADYDALFHLPSEFGIESVFEIAHGDSPAWWDWGYLRGSEGNLAAQMQGPRVTGSNNWNRGWSYATVSQKLVDDLSGDPRLSSTVLMQSEIDGNIVKGFQHTGFFSKKYSSDAEHWGSDGQFEHNRTCNSRVIRYADILLMAAELGSSNAQLYLDQVRSRVGLSSIPANEENILNERRLEFSLEGIRYFDLLRSGMDRANAELSDPGTSGRDYEGDPQIFKVTFNTEIRGFLPIPQTEIDLSNGVFRQNAGY